VERKNGDDPVWWAGEISAWGKGLKNIGIGAVGDTALALAARPDVVAVCGTRAVATIDKLDALAVLLRPGEPAEARVFDYQAPGRSRKTRTRSRRPRATALSRATRSCSSARPTASMTTQGLQVRDRLMIIESDLAAADDPAWTVAGLDQGVQTRALALDLDEQGRYLLAGYTCFDVCEPVGEVRVYAPGGKLVAPTISLGPLGSAWFGPHDIAWSPAGYAVVAMGGQQGQSLVFKVQAVIARRRLAAVDLHPERQAGASDRARGGGRALRRGLRRGHRRRRPPRVRPHRQLRSPGFTPAAA
jgi:hypothetical protein